jgi:PST family polysaccharide transporter
MTSVVLLILGPVILALLALVPFLVPLLYTPQFAPTIALLEWQLVGDILGICAWAMGFAILARSGGTTYLVTQLVSAASLLLFTGIGVRQFRLEGVGMAFLASSGIGYLMYWTVLRRTIGLRFTRDNRMLLGALLLAALVIRALPYMGFEYVRTPVALTIASAAACVTARLVWGEFGGMRGVMASRAIG